MIDGRYMEWPKLEARINAGLVTDADIESYLTGEALLLCFKVEQEYADLKAQPDVPDIEELTEKRPVLVTPATYSEPDPDTGECQLLTEAVYGTETVVVRPASSPNAIRDARIAELEVAYPYLVEPEPDADGYVPSLKERRPTPGLDVNLARQVKLLQVKASFEAALPTGQVDLSLGWPIDCRRTARHDDVGNMERLLRGCEGAGTVDSAAVTIRGADNADHPVTVAQLRDVVLPEMYQYGQGLYHRKWAFEAQVNDPAATVEDVLTVRWS